MVEENYENIDSEETKTRNLVTIQNQVLADSISEKDRPNKATAAEIKSIKVTLQQTKYELKNYRMNKDKVESQQSIDALQFELQMKSQCGKQAQQNSDENCALPKKSKDNILTLLDSRGWSPESTEIAMSQIFKLTNVHV